jgi:hypothetical protein
VVNWKEEAGLEGLEIQKTVKISLSCMPRQEVAWTSAKVTGLGGRKRAQAFEVVAAAWGPSATELSQDQKLRF